MDRRTYIRTYRFPLFYRTLSPPVPSGAAAQKTASWMHGPMYGGLLVACSGLLRLPGATLILAKAYWGLGGAS